MNREIKFRSFQDNEIIYQRRLGNNGASMFFNAIYEDAKVMQYTGLKDKNGKEIYEGDIFRYELLNESEKELEPNSTIYTEEVHFIDGSFELDNCPLGAFYDKGEVIGNIYENPELIK